MASNSRLPSARRPVGGVSKIRPVSMIEEPTLTNLPSVSNVTSEGDTSKRAKRRSLLPQFARLGSYEEKVDSGIKEENEEDDGAGSRPSSSHARDSVESSTRKGIDEDRKAMPPPSRLSRPVSMIPPRGASQLNKTHVTRSHTRENSEEKDADAEAARAESLAALTGTGATSPSKLVTPEAGLRRSGSTRMPQPSPRHGGPVIPSRTTSTVGGPVIPSRSTSTRTREKHSRTQSTTTGSTSARIVEEQPTTTKYQPQLPPQAEQVQGEQTIALPQRGSSITSRSRPLSSQISTQQASALQSSVMSRGRPGSQLPPTAPRANFNTYQQHYSPAKSTLSKPHIPSAKPSKPSPAIDSLEDTNVTFDVARQQIELLQLSLLHQASGQCMREYTASAKRKLGKKHTKLRKEYESIRATELVHQRINNLSALESWCRDPGMLVENLQILSLVYSDLTSLMEDGSRHGDILSMFQLWMNDAETPAAGVFFQPLPDDWKTAHASLSLKLRSIQRNLGVLPPPSTSSEDGSGLEVVLKGCKALVDGMLKELEIMGKLEKEVLARERNKIEEEVKSSALDVGMQQDWVPSWQKVA